MPAWRAEYFANAKDQVPSRIEIIEAEYETYYTSGNDAYPPPTQAHAHVPKHAR